MNPRKKHCYEDQYCLFGHPDKIISSYLTVKCDSGHFIVNIPNKFDKEIEVLVQTVTRASRTKLEYEKNNKDNQLKYLYEEAANVLNDPVACFHLFGPNYCATKPHKPLTLPYYKPLTLPHAPRFSLAGKTGQSWSCADSNDESIKQKKRPRGRPLSTNKEQTPKQKAAKLPLTAQPEAPTLNPPFVPEQVPDINPFGLFSRNDNIPDFPELFDDLADDPFRFLKA